MLADLKYILAQASGIPALINSLNRNKLLVLTYHGIYDGPRRDGLFPNTFVHVDDMVKQLRYVKRTYRTIDARELQGSLEDGTALPSDSALITFDDGYESFYRLAEPALRSMGIRALVFISTRYVERQIPLWFDMLWFFVKHATAEDRESLGKVLGLEYSGNKHRPVTAVFIEKMKRLPLDQRDAIMDDITQQIRFVDKNAEDVIRYFYPMTVEHLIELVKHGTTFGGHTHTHTILSSISKALAMDEISINKKKLEDLLGMPCNFFAYPSGGETDFQDEHKDLVRSAGYIGAFSLAQKRFFPLDDPMAIPRIMVSPEDTVQSLGFRCSGLTPYITWLRKYFS